MDRELAEPAPKELIVERPLSKERVLQHEYKYEGGRNGDSPVEYEYEVSYSLC